MNLTLWLQEKIGEELNLPAHEIPVDRTFEELGLDSISLVSVTFDLEEKLGVSLDPVQIAEQNTIQKIVEGLAENS